MQVIVLHLVNSPFMYEIFIESWSFKFDQGKNPWPELATLLSIILGVQFAAEDFNFL